MRLLDKSSNEFLYQQVIDFIEKQRSLGTLRPGDKLPSLRKLSRQFEISVPTVKQAYIELERQGTICARPQSGYYLKAQQARTLLPMRSKWACCKPVEVKCRSLIEQVHEAVHIPDTVALGISNPVNTHPPDKALARLMRSVISKVAEKAVSYGPVNGDPKLRTQLAFRYQDQGVDVNPDDIVITNGAQEALSIALQCVAQRGDVIAVESPCFFGIIELIESLGMKALEVYTCTEDGVCISELEQMIRQHPVRACLFSTAINNPLGSMMTDEQRQDLVQLLEQHDIPLIEDDVYSDLYFTESRPKPAQLYSEKGLVMTCSSFSKTAAPGYRVGWVAAGRYAQKVERLKLMTSLCASMPAQAAIADYLQHGGYDRHLRKLRNSLEDHLRAMLGAVARYFPAQTRVSQPSGGYFLWLELPEQVDSLKVFQIALAQGISVAPGPIFSPTRRFKNCIRLNYGTPWSDTSERAMETLGKIIRSMMVG